MILVSIIAVVGVTTAIIAYHDSVKKRKIVQIAQEYLQQKYKQTMDFEHVRLSYVDPVYYYVTFVSEKTNVRFQVRIWPGVLKNQKLENNEKNIRDDYLSSFFSKKTEEIALPEITEIWGDKASIYVALHSNNTKKDTSAINEFMTEREMEPFYCYAFYVASHHQLNSESKIREAQRVLNLFQAIRKLNYHPAKVFIWYQTGTIKEGKKIEKSVEFVHGSTPFCSVTQRNCFEIDNVEDIIKVMDEQWFDGKQ